MDFRYAKKVNQKNPQNPTKIVLKRPGISLKLMAVRNVQIQTPVFNKNDELSFIFIFTGFGKIIMKKFDRTAITVL